MPAVKGCHLVGSVPLSDTSTVLRTCAKSMPGRLKRLPDGETGSRILFVVFQGSLFPEAVQAKVDLSISGPPKPQELSEEQITEGIRSLEERGELNTGYDDAALQSYEIFKQLKKDGVIAQNIKFQVSLPTLGNTVGCFVERAFQPKAEELYEPALFKALQNIQDKIPHEELSIQLDMAVDMLYWVDSWTTPWWNDKSYLVNYVSRMANQVASDVELGFHFCYGDLNHKHMVEPESLAGVSGFAHHIFDKCQRPVQYIHCPVPLSAIGKLDSYFEPLKTLVPRLRQDGTELYLGLVHAHNGESTRKMIEAAGRVVEDFEFGVSTECGWGRTPNNDLESIIEISNAVSAPFVQN